MKLKLPEDLTALSAEDLAALLTAAIEEYTGIAETPDDDLTDEQLTDIEALSEVVDSVAEETARREEAAAARAERLAAARGKITAVTDSADDETDEEVDEDESEDDLPETDELDEVETETEREPVAASATRKSSAVARAARARVDTKPQPVVSPAARGGFKLHVAADVPNYASGSELGDWDDLAKAFIARSKGFSRGMQNGTGYGVAQLRKPENEFTVTQGMSAADQLDLIDRVADTKRLPKGGLIAAGGWCAPSETLYDFYSLEQVDGILSIPEFNVQHGGINFTTGPSYAALTADSNFGFLQTEAQAEAGTTKACYSIDCPDWTDVRMQAIGFCIKAGILTNAQFPELVRRFLQMASVGHAHRVNANVISQIQTALGTAIDFTEIGSGTVDLLNALELNAEVIRWKFAMAVGAPVEVVLPAWARLIARQDLANRNGEGISALGITDEQLTAWFSVRGLAVQWVYDYQSTAIAPASNAGKVMPTTVEALMYPAGTFVKGVADVINLEAVYDSTNITTNGYTAAFFEEGFLIAQRGIAGLKVSIALNYKGASGYPSIGAGSGISFAPAA